MKHMPTPYPLRAAGRKDSWYGQKQDVIMAGIIWSSLKKADFSGSPTDGNVPWQIPNEKTSIICR